MKRQLMIAGMLAALGSLAAVGVAAQYNNSSNTANANPNNTANNNLSSADQGFARNAAQGGLAEVKMGQLAEQKGSSQQVKDFGNRMVTDHTKANGELKLDAAKESIQLPSDMNKQDQTTYNNLSKLSGAAFDRAYARDMVTDHQKDISAFQKEAKDGKNETIKNFAATTTPTLQEHLTLAREMQNSVSQTSSRKPARNNNAG